MSGAARPRRAGPAALAIAVAALAACASWDGVLELDLEPVPDPESGPAVRIVRVSDERVFRRNVYHPSLPSLSASFPLEPAWTGRALGRRLGTRGGNLLTPADARVGDWVALALTRALRERGARVLPSDAGGGLPLEVRVLELWSWVRRSRHSIARFHFRGRLHLESPDAPWFGGREFALDRVSASGGASAPVWRRLVADGLLELARRAAAPWDRRPRP